MFLSSQKKRMSACMHTYVHEWIYKYIYTQKSKFIQLNIPRDLDIYYCLFV